jgi:tRNA pseudouridine32 synthase/23S rRNA pseudouridine746 synthase/23S rRNA pseudouridine1911/1915/1917 synthase
MKLKITQTISILDAVALLAPGSSKTAARSWIKEGRILIDGVSCTDSRQILNENQTIELGSKPRFAGGGLKILYEDRHIVVIEKPEGVLSVSTAFERDETAMSFLKARYKGGRVYPVHRLDQDTSGVMLFALTEKARDAMKETFEKHAIDRVYLAIIEGHLDISAGTWSSYQNEDANYYVRNYDDPSKGKLAITHYKVLASSKWHSLVEFKLETGRKNQIRAHCQKAGHSVAGDKKYGAETDPVKRLCLHAAHLGFEHPITRKKMSFDAPVPEQFNKLVRYDANS